MKKYDVKIIVAAHKEYQMPSDDMYLPLYVGAECIKNECGSNPETDYRLDNTGDNISELNPYFCELTGLYWMWKNLDADYLGLVQYRRHFSAKRKKGFDNVLAYDEIEPFLGKIKVFVPKKRRYYIETLYSHYEHTHYAEHLIETRKVIEEKYPQYLKSFDKVMKHTYGYMFNMMIMEKDILDEYCSWLFDILFELRKRFDVSALSAFQSRCFGRISEIIFNVWLDYKVNSGEIDAKEIKELPCVNMEKIDWGKKIVAFFKAKFFGTKYSGSF